MPADDAAYGLWLLDRKRPIYQTYRNYYAGEHPWMFVSDRMREVFEALMRRYRLNVCRPVVRGVTRRVGIEAWDGDDRASEWHEQFLAPHTNRLWRETVRQGDGYLMAWPQDTMSGPLKTHRIRADEAIVVYGEEDQDTPQFAVKWWTVTPSQARRQDDEQLIRVNVYYQDRVERFVSRSSVNLSRVADLEGTDLAPYTDDDAPDTLGYRGTLQAAGREGLLPVTHFACQPDATPYGTSILEDVLPIQDEINHVARTTLAATDTYGLPFRVFTAFQVEEETHTVKDPDTGEDVTVTSDNVPDYHPLKDWGLFLPGENSKAIQLPEADLGQLLEVRRAAVSNGTLVSGVPLGLLAEDSGSIPSGVALRVVESPLTDLVTDLHGDWEPQLRNHARLYGLEASPSWSSPISMDDTEKAQFAQQLIDAGLPAPKAFEDAGLMGAEDFVEAQSDYAEVGAGIGSRLVDAFNAGADPADMLRS